MNNKKKLKSRDGATWIAPDKSTGEFCGLYKLQCYNKRLDMWEDLEGCTGLTWTEVTTARKSYIALRQACEAANGAMLHINVPTDEGNGN